MPRHRRLTMLIATLIMLASAGGHRARAAEPPRWNILFVFVDDWGRYASCYRGLDGRPGISDVVSTPAIDRLAREGVVFRHAFVNAPSCTPCRSSLFSGRYFFNCGRGAILRNATWDESIPTFPLLLKSSGYTIGKSFKIWSPGSPGDAPYGRQAHAFEAAGGRHNDFSESVTTLLRAGRSLPEARAAMVAEVRGNFDAFLAKQAKSDPQSPWLYTFGCTTTHRAWVKGSGKTLWGIDPDALRGRLPAFLPDVPEVREDVADYLGEVQAVDAYVAALVARLEEDGALDRTLIVLSGDHGMPGVPAGKCDLYDHGTAVPLVARVPGVPGGRIVDDLVSLPDLCPTFLEVGGVPPPAGIAGRSLLGVLRSGRSGQVDPDRTWVIMGRERHVDMAREGNLPYPMRALRTKDWLYIRNFAPDRWPMGSPGIAAEPTPDPRLLEKQTFVAFADMDASPTKAWLILHRADPQWRPLYEHAFAKRPAEEFYHLRTDPDQMKNLAADPAHAATRADLAARLTEILMQAGDPRLSADVPFEKPPFTDRVEALLPSWKNTAARRAILDFVRRVTVERTPDFVPPAERIAVFDNDGTLWPEYPLPFQAAFAVDRLRARAATEKTLRDDPLVAAALAGDLKPLVAGDRHEGLLHVVGLTHANLTVDEFRASVTTWLATARHPRFERRYDDLAYLPMQELLTYLRENGFKTWIVSGGGADFMRVWSERVYGIPPEQVIGTTGRTRFELRPDGPVLVKTLEHLFVDDKAGKPAAIHHFLGRRPIACFGNSDGDLAMLQYTTIGNPRPSFGMVLHHTDAEREYAYDANPTGTGRLVDALAEAGQRGWTVVDMRRDWAAVFSAAP